MAMKRISFKAPSHYDNYQGKNCVNILNVDPLLSHRKKDNRVRQSDLVLKWLLSYKPGMDDRWIKEEMMH